MNFSINLHINITITNSEIPLKIIRKMKIFPAEGKAAISMCSRNRNA